jgi:hypothetical protein
MINAHGYANLPALAGLTDLQAALVDGLTVKEAVHRLKCIRWQLKSLHQIFVSRITSTPIYELKMAFSLHAHYCAEHVGVLAERVREMRQPPLGLDVSPDPALDLFFNEISAAPSLDLLLLGLYEKAVPALVESIRDFMGKTNKLFDHPSYRVCRFALLELEEIQNYGSEALKCLVQPELRDDAKAWLGLLDQMLSGYATEANRMYSATPHQYDPVPKRDERFQDSYNMGVNAEAMLFDPQIPPLPKTIMLYFKRVREIDVPEMMASILTETSGKPWDYYRDMTRQLWDEARHAMMGQVGFTSLGINWADIPLNFTWSLGLNTKLSPIERHAVLFAIEQGLMPKKVGKEYEWQVAVATADRLTSLIQDYDWADEVLHARIGRDWIVPELGSQAKAQAFGDEAWTRVLVDWNKWRNDGLTEHRNWWPDVYRAACKHWNVEPDPKLLAYNTTYENSRADLKEVAS